MSGTHPLTKREERRFGKQAARRYGHRIGLNHNRGGLRIRCWRCLWWSITGKHSAERRRTIAMFEKIDRCPHLNRRPNPNVSANPRVRRGEICDDCGVGLVQWDRREDWCP